MRALIAFFAASMFIISSEAIADQKFTLACSGEWRRHDGSAGADSFVLSLFVADPVLTDPIGGVNRPYYGRYFNFTTGGWFKIAFYDGTTLRLESEDVSDEFTIYQLTLEYVEKRIKENQHIRIKGNCKKVAYKSPPPFII